MPVPYRLVFLPFLGTNQVRAANHTRRPQMRLKLGVASLIWDAHISSLLTHLRSDLIDLALAVFIIAAPKR